MKDTKFRILLDIHEVRSQATIPVKVGDVSCKIYITLVEGGKPYKIHENSFGVFTGTKGDNNPILNNCIIENGIIRYDFTPQTVAAAGVLECEVRIYDEDGGVLTTPSFNIVVDERAVNDSELASAPEFAFLDEIIVNEGQRIENERNRNEAFNKLGIDLEDDGEVISIVKTDIDGSQEKASFLKYAGVIPPVTATATGSAITIESSQAPLQNLKLYGKTEQDGTPTPDNPIELKSVGDSGSFNVSLIGGNYFDKSKVDTRYATETKSGFSFINTDVNNAPVIVGVLKNLTPCLKVGDTVTFYTDTVNSQNSNGFVYLAESGFDWDSGVFRTITENDLNGYVYVYGVLNELCEYNNFRITKIENAPYEPYTEQNLTITDTLRSDKSGVTDEIDLSKGIKTQKNYSITINSMSGVSFGDVEGATRFGINQTPKASMYDTGMCNRLKVSTAPIGANNEDNCISCYSGGGVYFRCDELANATDKDAWLAENPIHFIYPLAEPIETPISESELNAYRQLYTNKGNTTILNSDGADMEISYYVNKPNAQAIGSLHEQINKDYFKLQQAIISTGGSTL